MTDIRPMSRSDIPAVAQLAAAQLYNSTTDELFTELQKAMRNPQQTIFLALSRTDVIASAQVSLRHDYMEGTHSYPVAYLEGIFMLPSYRQGWHELWQLSVNAELWRRAVRSSPVIRRSPTRKVRLFTKR